MKQPIKTVLSFVLVFIMLFTFIACDEDEKPATTAEPTEAPSTTLEPTEDSTAEPTEAPVTTAPSEEPTTAEPTESPVTTTPTEDSATTNPTVTTKPTEDSTTTKNPTVTTKPTEAPVTTVPSEEPTKAPVTTAPTEDPNVDYSKWGKHGFENLLPIPLPFSDEEADWISMKDSAMTYYVKNGKRIKFGNAADFIKTFEEYVKSFETYGYTVTCQNAYFTAQLGREQLFEFNCINGHVIITITLVS